MGLTEYEKEEVRNKSKLRNERFRQMKSVLSTYASYRNNLKILQHYSDEDLKYKHYLNPTGLTREQIRQRLEVLDEFEANLSDEVKEIIQWCSES